MATYGTHAVSDLLAATNQSVIEFGEDKTWMSIQALLDAHNDLLQEKLSTLVEVSTDRQRRYGGGDSMTMGDIDEYGTPDAQKVGAGDTVGFPLRKKGRSLQWTYTYLEENTPADLVGQARALMDADIRSVDAAILRAIFTPTNSTFVDRLVDNVSLAVKALVNADGASIPPDPYGNIFNAATHQHYLANATYTAAFLASVIDTVVEHFAAGQVMLWIAKGNESAVRAMTGTGEFTPYPLQDIISASTVTVARGTLDPNRTFNRAIGVFGNSSAQVWVKPWIPMNYVFAYMAGAPKPLVMRVRNARNGRLRMVYEDEVHPLRARTMEREFGLGVWTRTNGAAGFGANATYTAPVFTG